MISLLCPTRGRPDNMRRFAYSAIEHAEQPVEIVFYIDDDDQASSDALRAMAPLLLPNPVWGTGGPRVRLAETWNACADLASGDVLGHLGDDVVFHTPGWDRLVTDAFAEFEDRIAFVYGRDGVHDERLGTHGFVHRRWVDTIGYLTPPYFAHDYCDTWLNEVAGMIGRRRFLPDVSLEHLHPDVQKAPMDDTYREHIEAGRRDNVAALYASLAHERRADAEKLRAVML